MPLRWLRLLTVTLMLLPLESALAEFDVYGFVAGRAGIVDGPDGWLQGGFGRFDVADDRDEFAVVEGQVAVDWIVNDRLLLHFQGAAYLEDAASKVDEAGLIEAYLRYQVIESGSNSLSLTLGQKFLPTSFENTDDLWQSPYTLTYSVWNSWIAHEVRPIGLELSYSHFLESGARVGVRANVFGGNDSSGALLAWGGWRATQRLTLLGEKLPLPDITTLRDGGSFADQRDDGSKPFGPDLDDSLGGAIQFSYSGTRINTRFTYWDNNGDEDLHRGEYAWRTRFALLGGEWQVADNWTLIAEVADGDSRMGPPGQGVDIDFRTAYVMASYVRSDHRLTLRYEQFEIDDEDGLPTDNSEDGDGLTLAYFYTRGAWRFGAEYSDINADRPAAAESGFDLNTDGEKLTFEVRYVF